MLNNVYTVHWNMQEETKIVNKIPLGVRDNKRQKEVKKRQEESIRG